MGKSSKLGPGPTGPRTPQGKARSSRNAIKHGLFSERVTPAEEKEAGRLHRELRKDLHLEGLENELFGSNIVLTMLKKVRLDKFARYEFSKANAQAFRDEVRSGELRWSLKRYSSSSPNSVHPAVCALFLKSIKAKVEQRGLNPEEDLAILYSLFTYDNGEVKMHGQLIILPYEMVRGAKPGGSAHDGGSRMAELQTRVLSAIQLAIEFEQGLAQIDLMHQEEELRATDSAFTPDAVADRILRAETAIENQIKRQLDGLETYRRLRVSK